MAEMGNGGAVQEIVVRDHIKGNDPEKGVPHELGFILDRDGLLPSDFEDSVLELRQTVFDGYDRLTVALKRRLPRRGKRKWTYIDFDLAAQCEQTGAYVGLVLSFRVRRKMDRAKLERLVRHYLVVPAQKALDEMIHYEDSCCQAAEEFASTHHELDNVVPDITFEPALETNENVLTLLEREDEPLVFAATAVA